MSKQTQNPKQTPGKKPSQELSPRNRRLVLIRLWKYLFKYKYLLLLAMALTFSSNLLALIGPSLAGKAIDAFGTSAGQVDFPRVFRYITQMLVFYALSSGFAYMLSLLMIHLSQKVVYKMREDVFNRLSDLPVGYFDRTRQVTSSAASHTTSTPSTPRCQTTRSKFSPASSP